MYGARTNQAALPFLQAISSLFLLWNLPVFDDVAAVLDPECSGPFNLSQRLAHSLIRCPVNELVRIARFQLRHATAKVFKL